MQTTKEKPLRIPLSVWQCAHCGAYFNMSADTVKLVKRWGDCDEIETPCCHRRADTRNWTALPTLRRIEPGEIRVDGRGNFHTEDGKFVRIISAAREAA
jgi:hypothetical protein